MGTAINMPLFNFENIEFRYDPFPIAAIPKVFPPDIYNQMLDEWPATDKFLYMPKLGHKYSLSEVNNRRDYHKFIMSSSIWKRVYDEIKSKKFVLQIIDLLMKHNIDLGMRGHCVVKNRPGLHLKYRAIEVARALALARPSVVPLKSRFEFSMLPGDGGCIKPHTDAPAKHITLVVAMVRPGEWKKEYGGGTTVLRPKDIRKNYNFVNRMDEFEDMEELHTYEFVPNQCVVFVKTFNSHHAVSPIRGHGEDLLRKTLTINIETPKI